MGVFSTRRLDCYDQKFKQELTECIQGGPVYTWEVEIPDNNYVTVSVAHQLPSSPQEKLVQYMLGGTYTVHRRVFIAVPRTTKTTSS